MNESVWWSFLYFMGEGRARDWGESQVSQGQGEGQPSEKKQPPQLGSPGGGNKKPPLAGKPGGGKEKTPASWKKPGGSDEKNPPTRWKGQRRVKVSAHVRSQRSEPKPGLTPRTKEASASPTTRAEKHTQRKKKVLGLTSIVRLTCLGLGLKTPRQKKVLGLTSIVWLTCLGLGL